MAHLQHLQRHQTAQFASPTGAVERLFGLKENNGKAGVTTALSQQRESFDSSQCVLSIDVLERRRCDENSVKVLRALLRAAWKVKGKVMRFKAGFYALLMRCIDIYQDQIDLVVSCPLPIPQQAQGLSTQGEFSGKSRTWLVHLNSQTAVACFFNFRRVSLIIKLTSFYVQHSIKM